MARLGLGYAGGTAVNPRIVYCSMSGYGIGGEMEQAAGHDANCLALADVMAPLQMFQVADYGARG